MAVRRKLNVVWTLTAQGDLSSIIDYIADESAEEAGLVFDRIRKAAAKLYVLPQRGRLVPELLQYGIRNYRELIVGPWRLLYRVSEAKVFVVAVIDSRRNVEDLLLERFCREPFGPE
ncbi:MAG TPA: type II toxin-antitoxin system RelE/ParE family toxin [Acidobacteriota bacterium]|nr:type II toxin-antitoxin system RelE/ParE family toxin [Acidobacteriota bacterium]